MRIKLFLVPNLCIVFLIGLSGCAHYRAKQLNKLSNNSIAYEKDEQFISLDYRIFKKRDCRKYLDRNVLSKGYQPIQITFTNNSSRQLELSMERFSLPLVPIEEVADTVHTNTTRRAVGYCLAGLVFWPFAISAVVDGVGSSNANKKLDRDFDNKQLHNKIVEPFSSVNGLIFVQKEDFDEDFSLTIIDKKNNDKFVLSTATRRLNIFEE